MMSDSQNDKLNNDQKDNNLPEWLAQFREELNTAKTGDNAKSQSHTAPYDNPEFKSSNSIMMGGATQKVPQTEEYRPFAFMDLAGYKAAVNGLKKIGVGNHNDKINDGIVSALNRFHGVASRPALRPILMIGESIEEINPLVQATVDELSLPTVRLELQEAMNGMPAMAVTANKSALNQSKNRSPLTWVSDNSGVLILERVEDWTMFFDEPEDEDNPFFPIKLTPTGSELINLVERAAKNPQVQLICTTCEKEAIPFEVWDMLGQVNEIVIEKPTRSERIELWNKLSGKHPSLRGLNNHELAELTENLSRRDLEMIAQDAVSEAYQSGLQRGACKSVTRENIYEKIILRTDKNSSNYRKLEDALVKAFTSSFDI